MMVVSLGDYVSPIAAYLRSRESMLQTSGKVTAAGIPPPFVIVSHGYRHILTPDVIAAAEVAVNVHIGYLPWNRGASPNLWSFVDGTPKGVTLHLMDAGIDTGPIIAQQQVPLSDLETLRSSYAKLQQAAFRLFVSTWPSIRERTFVAVPQPEGGSFHTVAQTRATGLLDYGLDIPIRDLLDWASEDTLSAECADRERREIEEMKERKEQVI
jgi:methionyl-tRNA formyltransferase